MIEFTSKEYLYYSESQKTVFLTFTVFCIIFISMIDTLKDFWHLSLSSLDEWVNQYSNYENGNYELISNYQNTHSRLMVLWKHLVEGFTDPIEYIISLSKEKHCSDKAIAQILNNLLLWKKEKEVWTSKMVFTLRKQIWLKWNDGTQYLESGDQNVKEYNQRNIQKVEEIIRNFPRDMEKPPENLSIEEVIDILLLSTNWKNIDAFFQEMVLTHHFWERPIKQILDTLYDIAEIPGGKGHRVGMVYIRTKISIAKLMPPL